MCGVPTESRSNRKGEKMSVYENWSDQLGYIYFKKQGQPSVPGMHHEIAGRTNFHKAVEFIILTKGTQSANINGKTFSGRGGVIFFIDSLCPHSYPRSENVDGYILVLSEWYMQFFRSLYGERTWPPLLDHIEANGPIIDYVREWFSDQGDNPYEKFNRANRFFAMLAKEYPPQVIPRAHTNEIAVEMLTYIEENYDKDISMKSIAEHLGYAKQYCSKVFNSMVDESFRKYLNRIRILKFEELWRNNGQSRDTILKTAFSCGFDSSATFYRAYKEVNGTTPKSDPRF